MMGSHHCIEICFGDLRHGRGHSRTLLRNQNFLPQHSHTRVATTSLCYTFLDVYFGCPSFFNISSLSHVAWLHPCEQAPADVSACFHGSSGTFFPEHGELSSLVRLSPVCNSQQERRSMHIVRTMGQVYGPSTLAKCADCGELLQDNISCRSCSHSIYKFSY